MGPDLFSESPLSFILYVSAKNTFGMFLHPLFACSFVCLSIYRPEQSLFAIHSFPRLSLSQSIHSLSSSLSLLYSPRQGLVLSSRGSRGSNI